MTVSLVAATGGHVVRAHRYVVARWIQTGRKASAYREARGSEHLDAGGSAGEGGHSGIAEIGRRPHVNDGHRHRLGTVEHRLVTIGRPGPLGEVDRVDRDAIRSDLDHRMDRRHEVAD